MKRRSDITIRTNVTFEEFEKVFKVFETFPFFESWTREEIEQEYKSFLYDGIIFGAYNSVEECVAILTMNVYKIGKHPVQYPSTARVMYLSDVATRFEYRNLGIGTLLFEHAIRHTKVLGYDYIYLRTNKENSMSYSIAKRCGFEDIPNIIEEVERNRVDGTVAKDARIFMEKKLFI